MRCQPIPERQGPARALRREGRDPGEIEKRYGALLGRKVDPRTVSAKLRRMAQAGKIHLVRKGRALYGALYTKSAAGV